MKIFSGQFQLSANFSAGYLGSYDISLCNQWLAEQNYAELSVELHQLIDSGNAGLRMEVHQWIVDCLQKAPDPLLLYMDARTVLKFGLMDRAVYERALRHFVYCVVMADIAHEVVRKMGRVESGGRQMQWVAGFLREKFIAQYGASSFAPATRNLVPFTQVREYVIDQLKTYELNSTEKLPFWVLNTQCGSRYSWGISWGSVVRDECAIRQNKVMIASLVELIGQALPRCITYLKHQDTWEKFLGLDVDHESVLALDENDEDEFLSGQPQKDPEHVENLVRATSDLQLGSDGANGEEQRVMRNDEDGDGQEPPVTLTLVSPTKELVQDQGKQKPSAKPGGKKDKKSKH